MSKKSLFTEVPAPKVSRNLFNLSHEVKMSGKFGFLYPVLLCDAMPGDTFRDTMTAFMRFAPMLAPIMHRIDVTTHFFFVPNRLVTDHWEDFITGGRDGDLEPVLPYIRVDTLAAAGGGTGFQMMQTGSLWDYLGLPVYNAVPGVWSQEQITALPFRAYAKIWNDWYRDPNLDDEISLGEELEGNVTAVTYGEGMFELRRRGWEKDFYTSALPWAQRGAEVLLPLAGTGTIDPVSFYDVNASAAVGNLQIQAVGLEKRLKDSGGADITDLVDGLPVTMDESSVSINDFRRSMAIQRWLENNARGGGRYIEQIQSHYNVRVPDYRLQRTEYLGGGKQNVTISEVLSTADTAEVPVGDMAGHGISVGRSNEFTYRCQEHGFIVGILSVMPRTAYSQGIDRMWIRQNKFDYAFPELANLGEQEIISKEVFYSFDNADAADNNEVFGYIPRYAEYKFKNDRIAGDFRGTLGFWHLGRFFNERPVLDSLFTTMYENGAQEETFRRIFAVQDGTDYLWMQLFHKLTAKRPLPYFGVPSLK